ncbi:hypothetical protein ASPBRDRAFT_137960 [Aspergillus brasiliensis CBS 101740]|uniref:D-isomer specific 2-hydroxyacid dehydrogenase NAD-binding domain-containing protein n=1 Tax=Aspergillus brasiliensis (strain CBS 101740 / IMI 381727 / IBT 21946) TaxID=767769 RepID=A0A1L9U3X0_ASPBC|nr:hypothetical protein ASPBRDRAFT_137960 [Aspergillus brasiliensis CBS 101740]
MSPSKIRLAILDDYQGVASDIFSRVVSNVEIGSFPETLHPEIQTEREALIARLSPFDVISTMRERTGLPATVISALPNLKLILTTGMKNSSIDMQACTARGIPVLGAKGLGSQGLVKPPTSLDSTLEHTWALILALARNVARDDWSTKNGGWENSFATGLKGKTLGLLGLGRLGADVGRVGALAFGMKILTWSSNLTQSDAEEKSRALGLPAGTFKVAESKEELVQKADVLSIHYVLSERSVHLLTARELALMKRSSLLINTSRGCLIDENDLLSTLKSGAIRGAAVDVYNVEPLPAESEWRTVPWGEDGRSTVLLSPHMGYVEEGVMHRWYEDSAANLKSWIEGGALPTRLN